MNRLCFAATVLFSAALLFPAASLFAAPADTSSATGMWVVDGDVMGQPVKMTCTLTEKEHKLSGSCAGPADNFTPHVIAGKVKEQAFDLYFQTYIQGNPITLSMTGTLSDDRQRASGDLDVEPMNVAGTFTAKRVPDAAPATAEAAAPPAPVVVPATPASAVTPVAPVLSDASLTAAGVWKVDGDVMGTPVKTVCTLVEKEHKLTGKCVGVADDVTPRELAGETKGSMVAWSFGTEYQGTPITVGFSAKLADDGTTMTGSISVPEMQVDGTFSAKRQ